MSNDELVVPCGTTGPLFPVSTLMVLPGQFWKQKTDLADIASHAPTINYNTLINGGTQLFGFSATGLDSQATTLVSTTDNVWLFD